MSRLDIVKKWVAGHEVLHDISRDIGEGRVSALIGPSGSGKSTLLRCINLLETPDNGVLTIGDASIAFRHGKRQGRHAVEGIRRQTGMVFQNFQLFPHQTALGNVMEGLVTRSEEHTSELQSLMRISYAVFCLKKTTYMQSQPTKELHTIIHKY